MKLRPPFSLKKAWIVFVDQPLGTGLSHVDPACAWCDVVHNRSALNELWFSFAQARARRGRARARARDAARAFRV